MHNRWKLHEAQSRFRELVERALSQGAQIVTCCGINTVVVLPYAEYQHLTQNVDSLAQFLLASPLPGSELDLLRDRSTPRDLGIES